MRHYTLHYENIETLSLWLESCALTPCSSQLIQIFSGLTDPDLLRRITATIYASFPDATVIGTTTSGEIFEGEILEEQIVISLCTFDQTTLRSIHLTGEDSKEMGREAALAIVTEATRCVIMFADGLHCIGDDVIKGFNSAVPRELIVAGGMSGDNDRMVTTYCIHGNDVFERGIVAVALTNPELEVFHTYNLSWRPIGREMTITKAEGNKVYEIDHQPVLEVYAHYLGDEVIQNMPGSMIEFPLIYQEGNVEIARSTLAAFEDGGVLFAGEMPMGKKVRFGIGSPNMIDESTKKSHRLASQHPIEGLFVYSCTGRKNFLGKRLETELYPLAKIAPLSGFFTYGEFYHGDDSNKLLNVTSTVLGLSETRYALHDSDPVELKSHKAGSTINALMHLVGVVMDEERAKLEDELVESNKNLRSHHIFLETLLENSPIPIYHKSIEGVYLGCNSAFADIIGLEKNRFIGKNVFDIALPEFALTCSAKDQELLANPQSTQIYEYQLQNQTTDEIRDGIFYKRAYCNEEGEVVGIIGSFIDITERKRAENEFFKLSQAVEQSPTSIIITDLLGNIEYANANFYTINGYSPEEVLGQNPRLFQSGKTPRSTYESLWSHLRRHEKWHGEFINRSKDGTEYIQSVNISPIFQPDGKITHYMAIEEDITEKKRSEEQIYHLANFDSLTGLPNRAQLQNYFNYTLNLSKRNGTPFVVMFLDLDHFKEINDTLGHTIGDRMLVESAKRFSSLVRDVDIVARLGGDEFIIVLSNTDAHGAERVLQKLFEAISHPYHIEQYGLNISASVGIAIYPTDGKDIETLSKNADTAMYRAKQEGRNGYRFFTEEMQTSSLHNLRLSNALRNALKNNEFHLLYQPQISIEEGKVIGAEALIRWSHPELGNVSPAEFIPVAEENGLILPIGEWVLRTAIAQVRAWMEEGQSPIVMSVNLSTVQFRHHDLPNLVSRILHENNVPAEYLELELTESMATHDPHSAITIMNNFHARGIRMSIDDFGTGYSSLSYLKQFKIYKLKIDRSFVRDITTDADDKAIVSAVINMAHSLGLQTIAEGVETLEQLRYLREQGCDEIQGYYFSKPVTPDQFTTFVATPLPALSF